MTQPIEEYQQRLEARKCALARLERWESRIANARLAVFVFGAVLTWITLKISALALLWVLLPFAAFLVLVVVHDRVLQAVARVKRGIAYYERGVARIEDRWMGAGWDGLEFARGDHPYAADVDLFGPGSLFQLLCTMQTRSGGKMLADWLCRPAAPEEVRARQAAVEELRPRVDLREALADYGHHLNAGVMPERIAAWAAAPPVFGNRWLGLAAYAASGWVLLSGCALAYGAPIAVFMAGLVLLSVLHLLSARQIRAVIAAAAAPSRELEVVGNVLAHLERERFEDPYLRKIQESLREEGRSASEHIEHLRRLLRLQEASLNLLFQPVSAVSMWSLHFARAIDAWRATHGTSVEQWLEGVGRLEALCALASYAYEHPGDPFPEITGEGPAFVGKGLGHPLLPAARCVRNDVALDGRQRLLIVSGSNMSGKSVLLRTVGTNVVLALMGAPVRAHALSLSPLNIGATLNVHDALQEGVSRFYAEITRIRMLMDLAQGAAPLLFLLDEIFHGTNSWDRRIGAQAVLRNLLEAGAIGIITTHDLAITELAGGMDGRAVNVHFEDHLEGNRLVFDYQLRPGIVQKSNALDLMRAIGLRVE